MAKLNAVCRPSLKELVIRLGKKRSPVTVAPLGRGQLRQDVGPSRWLAGL